MIFFRPNLGLTRDLGLRQITNYNQLKNYNGKEEFESYSIINAILARITQCSISKFNAILKTFFQGLHDKTLEIKMSHLYMF